MKMKKEFLLGVLRGEEEATIVSNEITDNTRWSIHHYMIFEYKGKYYGVDYSVGATEMQDESPWQYEGDMIEVRELKKAKVTREEFVSVDYVEEKSEAEKTAEIVSNGLSFLMPPPADLDPVAQWAFYNRAEKEAKSAKEAIAKVALKTVSSTLNKFQKTQYGGAQLIEKTVKKAKDTLKFILQQKGQLEMCRKDDIDLKKVDELVEAGILDRNEIEQHIEVKKTSHLQIKK